MTSERGLSASTLVAVLFVLLFIAVWGFYSANVTE